MTSNTRNQTLVFAERARKNLDFIEKHAPTADVHPVTQLAISLLGLVVFPKERLFLDDIADRSLESLASEGWPTWEMSLGSCETLGELVRHLRNAVAHGRLYFSSDSRELDAVDLEVEDAGKDGLTNWKAKIAARDLRDFCLRFIKLIENTVG